MKQAYCHNCFQESTGRDYELYVGKKVPGKLDTYPTFNPKDPFASRTYISTYKIFNKETFFICDKCVKEYRRSQYTFFSWYSVVTIPLYFLILFLQIFVITYDSGLFYGALVFLIFFPGLSGAPWMHYLGDLRKKKKEETAYDAVKRMVGSSTKSQCHSVDPESLEKLMSMGIGEEKANRLAQEYHWSAIDDAIKDFHRYKFKDPNQLVDWLKKSMDLNKKWHMEYFSPAEYAQLK